MSAAESLSSEVNVRQACRALDIPRASYYRWKHREDKPDQAKGRPVPPLALSENEDQRVMEVLHSDRFINMAPVAIHATLLDEGKYLCSTRTMYRKLAKRSIEIIRRIRRAQFGFVRMSSLDRGHCPHA